MKNACLNVCARSAVLLAAAAAMPSYGQILQVDINDITNTTNTQSGFSVLTRDTGGAGQMVGTFGNVTVDIDPVGFSFGDFDRVRTLPTDNPPQLTESAIYQDFVFSDSGATGTRGYDTTFSGLRKNTWYNVDVWSFDRSSTSNRVSDWTTVGGNGTVLVADNYTFDGASPPAANDDNKFSFWVQTDNSGQFSLEGRNVTAGSQPAVFINGLAITERLDKLYRIDFDSADTGGQALQTTPGWTSLDATGTSNNAIVTIDGIDFQPFSADGSRNRPAGSNSLTSDFIFDDGSGQAVGLLFGGSGDLEAGTWRVEMYVWDDDSPDMDDVIVGLRRNGGETIIDTAVSPVEDGVAITFTFESDGSSAYDVFVRDAPGGDTRARLNAVTLALVPEPSSLALLGLGGLAVLRRRR